MPLKVSIRTEGFQKVDVLLSGIKSRMADFSVPLKQGGQIMLRSVDLNFRSGGRPTWPPLALSTALEKARNRYSRLPLQRIGTLRSSITYRTTPTSLVIGTSSPYARIHQFGGVTRPRVTDRMRRWAWRQWYETEDERYKAIALTKKESLTVRIPKRPFLVFQRQDTERIARLIEEYVTGAK